MKNRYLDVMERALGAYSTEQIDEYFAEVKRGGLTEHGFARLVANIGTQIAHGRRKELESRFIEMMSFCCDHVSTDRAANDFSIQEMIACIDLLEKRGAVSRELIEKWREGLKKPIIYNEVAKSPDQLAYSWVLFSATSEFLRMKRGLCPLDMDFIDMQLATQVVHLDENLMYRDAAVHPPMVYDNVPRTLFSILLFYGYDGKYRELIDNCLKNAGSLSLRMQSSTGEIAFGGRSNQFYHNEAHLAAIFEYEAARYKKEGNISLARKFKRGALDALASICRGLEAEPIHHVKNRFPLETQYGCEDYAYFNKYMITVASFLNWARLFCDEEIDAADEPIRSTDVFSLSEDFHKTFLRAGDYFAELDTNADMHYDASGLGRLHKRGAPSEICLSCPGSASPNFKIDTENAIDFSIAPGIFVGDEPVFKTEGEYRTCSTFSDEERTPATFECEIDGKKLDFSLELDKNGALVSVRGDGIVALMLPAFFFDGEEHTKINCSGSALEVCYKGYICTYSANGKIFDTERLGCNRNGHYKIFFAAGDGEVKAHISIEKT